MPSLQTIHRHGLFFIIFISVAVFLLKSTVSAVGSFQLRVLAVRVPEPCRCRKNSLSSLGYDTSNVTHTATNEGVMYGDNFGTTRKSSFDFKMVTPSRKGSPVVNESESTTTTVQSTHAGKTSSSNSGSKNTSSVSNFISPTNITNGDSNKHEANARSVTHNCIQSCSCKRQNLSIAICLAHHQRHPADDLRCTLGQATTRSTISLKSSDILPVVWLQDPPVLSIPFSYSWPGGFTLKVVATLACGTDVTQEVVVIIVYSILPSSNWVVISGHSSTLNPFTQETTQKDFLEPYTRDSVSKNSQEDSAQSPEQFDAESKRRRRSVPTDPGAEGKPEFTSNQHEAENGGDVRNVYKMKSVNENLSLKPMLRTRNHVYAKVKHLGGRLYSETHGASKVSTRLRSRYRVPRSKVFALHSRNIDNKSLHRHRRSLSHDKRSQRTWEGRSRHFFPDDLLKNDQNFDSLSTKEPLLKELNDGQLLFAVRAVCSENYYGRNCTLFCRARDDYLGHYECTTSGQQICKNGWRGLECSQAICSARCQADRALCTAPNTCVCRPGWHGEHCDRCRLGTGCVHGSCSQPGQCICHFGWTGPRCDKKELFCKVHKPCTNGGTCTHLGQHTYNCTCLVGYKGRHCEITACYDGFCHRRGECFVSEETRLCRCADPYTGTRCQFRIEDREALNSSTLTQLDTSTASFPAPSPSLLLPSLPSPKLPSSEDISCAGIHCGVSVKSNEPNSSCTGALCDRAQRQEKSEPKQTSSCQTLSCYNGGICTKPPDTIVEFCACPEPYSGRQCLHDSFDSDLRSPCSTNPCYFTAVCFNIVLGTEGNTTESFLCKCKDGFSGERCDQVVTMDTSICASKPCRNGGTCVEYDGEFMCACTEGFRGDLCTKRKKLKGRRVTRVKVKVKTTIYSPLPRSPSSAASSIPTYSVCDKTKMMLSFGVHLIITLLQILSCAL